MNVLVAYGSRHGSTAEIARRLGDRIRDGGCHVDVLAVGDALDVDAYDAVVIGSGVYDGSWAPEATAFLRGRAALLVTKPVWLFSVGSFGDRHLVVGKLIAREPRELAEFMLAVRSRGHRVFAGVIELEHWPGWARIIFTALGGHPGDNRQWPDIDAWGREIATVLMPRVGGSKRM